MIADCCFIGSSLKDLRTFPEPVKDAIGFALYDVQSGLEPSSAKAMKGFGGRGILELIENYDGDTFRAVYTVRFAEVVYVLHCFQKKSKSGIATPLHDVNLIKGCLKAAELDYRKGAT